MLRQLVLFVMLAVIAAMPARAETVRPFDEGPQDKSFLAFRTSVLTALKARNYRALGRAASVERDKPTKNASAPALIASSNFMIRALTSTLRRIASTAPWPAIVASVRADA